jgi:hypothetical protein
MTTTEGKFIFILSCVRSAKSVTKEDQYLTTMCIPEAKSTTMYASVNIIAKDEPWVLARKVDQCFFITDSIVPSRVVVRTGKRSIIIMDGFANDEEFDHKGDPNMEGDDEEIYTTIRSKTMLPKLGLLF